MSYGHTGQRITRIVKQGAWRWLLFRTQLYSNSTKHTDLHVISSHTVNPTETLYFDVVIEVVLYLLLFRYGSIISTTKAEK